MNTHTVHPRDLISERTARRAAAHPRTAVVPDAAPAAAADAAVTTPREALSREGPRILRRWSVAELIALAPRPPAVA